MRRIQRFSYLFIELLVVWIVLKIYILYIYTQVIKSSAPWVLLYRWVNTDVNVCGVVHYIDFYRPRSKIVISHTASVTLTLVKFGNSLSWQDHLYVRGEGTDCFSLCLSFSMSLLLGETSPGDRESFGLLDRLECLTGVSLLELSMADRSSLSLLWPGDVERERERERLYQVWSLRQIWPIIHS